MRDFLLAPLLSVCSLKFYRRIGARSIALGFLYVSYLGLLFTLWSFALFRQHTLPLIDDFAGWVSKSLPKITFTQEGMQMESNQPVLLTHPRFGPLLYFNPANESPSSEDLAKALIVFTRKKVIFHNPSTGELRMQSLVPTVRRKDWKDMIVTGERVSKFWRKVRPFLGLAFFLIVFLGSYAWKFLAGLFYSLIGLLMNLLRKERLRYAHLLNLSFFALTPASLLQILAWQFPGLRLPVNFFVALPITCIYIGFAILGTRKPSAEQN